MEALQIIVIITGMIELGLASALLYRSRNRVKNIQSVRYPHFRAESEKFYRSHQSTDGTWEIL